MTKQGLAVLNVINNSCEHLSADMIYMAAKREMPSISVGTVYRNLAQLSELGLIRRLPMPNGADRYDKSVIPHGHLVCTQCNEVTDVPAYGLLERLSDDFGVEISSLDLTARCICKKCKAMQTGE